MTQIASSFLLAKTQINSFWEISLGKSEGVLND